MEISLDYTQKMSFVRYLDNTLIPARFTVRADVMPTEGVDDLDIDISFAKIKFWCETIVSRSIVFSRNNLMALDMLLDADGKPRLTNNLMITPDEPNDDHFAAVLQSKMTALAKGKIVFGCVRIENDSPSGLVFTYLGDWQDDLPVMADWFTTQPYYFSVPWWVRDDASTLDLIAAGDQIDVSKPPPWAFSLDFIEDAVRPLYPEKPIEQAVIRGAFRPKVINGGQDEK